MRILFSVIKISAKKSFQKLRDHSPYFCKAIGSNIFVTKKILSHITSIEKGRSLYEMAMRLSIIPLIEDILQEGEIVEVRENNKIGIIFLKISHTINHHTFSVIIEQKEGDNFLISCFREFKYQKRDLS